MTRVRFAGLLIALTICVAETGLIGSTPTTVPHSSPSLDGLVGWWKFDESGGTTALDSSGNGHVAAINGAAYTTTDGAETPANVSALRFPGTVTVPSSPAFNFTAVDPFTVSFWIRLSADYSGEFACIVNKPWPSRATSVYAICNGRDGVFALWWNGSGLENTSVGTRRLEPGRLTHVAVVYDGAGTMQFYRDGQLAMSGGDQDRGALQGATSTVDSDLTIGGGFHGMLDDLRIYNRALSALEVSSLSGVRGLEVDEAVAPYSRTATLKARLFSGNQSAPGKSVSFTVDGGFAGTAVTDADGVATLPVVSVAGLDVGEHPTTIGASVAGDGQIAAGNGIAMLTIVPDTPIITWTIPEFPIGTQIDPTLIKTATAIVAGTFDYSLLPDTLLPYYRACVIFTPDDLTRYTPTTACTFVPWDQGAHIPVETVLPNGGASFPLDHVRGVAPAAIDSGRNFVYATGTSGEIQVIDGTTSEIVTTILLQHGPISGWASFISIDEALNRLYVADASQAVLWTIDASTRSVLEATPLRDPQVGSGIWRGMAFNPSSRLLYLTVAADANQPQAQPSDLIAVIDPQTPQFAIATLNLAGPYAAGLSFAIDSATNLVYVSHGGGAVSVIGADPATPSFNQIIRELSVGNDSVSVAVNTRTHAVYVAKSNPGARYGVPARLIVLDGDPAHASFGDLAADIPLPESPVLNITGFEYVIASAVAVNPVTNTVYVKLDMDQGGTQVTELDGPSLTQRSVTVLDHDVILQNVLFEGGALAVNPITGRIYLAGGVGEQHLTVVMLDRSESSAATPAGGGTSVQTAEVSISVPAVSSGGATTVTQVDATQLNLSVPGQYSIGGALAYDVTTTAVVGFPVQLCFNVSSIDDPETFDALAVLHGENGVLVDRTTSRDFATRTICATVNSLSPFVIARRTTPLDTTPPLVSCNALANAWSATDVTIWCTASDAASGLANAADASFPLMTAVPAGVETANAATTSRTVCDAVSNCVLVGPAAGLRIDMRAPTITMTAPAQATYVLHQAVLAAYACSDGGSGVAACTGSAANGTPFDTGVVGSHTFSVTATDAVGNTTTSNRTYTVVYNQCMLFDATKSYQAGSTVPIKLQLCDANGVNVSDASIPLVATSVYLVSTSASGAVADSGNANPDNQFRFAGGSYVFNLSLKGFAHGTYALRYRAGSDPTPHVVQFQVK